MASSPQAGPVLEIAGLHTEIRRRDATVRAVDGVSLTLRGGESLGLVGESGSGKTMTVRSIMRLLPRGGVITAGSVVLAGAELTNLTEQAMRQVRGNDIGMVFQDPFGCLNPTMTIGSQIAESVIVHKGADRRAGAERAIEMLGLVRMPDPERVAGQHAHELSGGMRQRAMIAAALACEPKLLIADEPTTALDVTIQRDILDLIGELRAQLGMAVILVTHDLGVIAGRTEQVAVMYGGRIIERATTAGVFAGPRHPYTKALFEALPELAISGRSAAPAAAEPATTAARLTLYSIPGRPPDLTEPVSGCSFAPRCRQVHDWCTSHDPALDGDHPGHTYACFFPVRVAGPDDGSESRPPGPRTGRRTVVPVPPADGAGQQPEPLLRVSGLVKEYPVYRGLLRRQAGVISAVANVSFELAAGQTFGLVGESGCGKTSIARLLVGLERATAGSIVFSGSELAGRTPRQLREHRPAIQLMFQDAFASLDPRMRVRSMLSEPLVIQKAGRRRTHRRQVARILDEVGLPGDAADRYPREFSGGQRQRLALARALILRPSLIVADEPVSALDVSVQAQILNLMRKLQRQYGLSYLFISHDLSVIRYVADTIGVMYLGKLVEVGPAEDICTAPGHPYTKGLIDAVPVISGGAPEGPGRGQPTAAAGDPAADAVPGSSAWQPPPAVPPSAVPPSAAPPSAAPPSGCRFRLRCPLAQDACADQEPVLRPHPVSRQLVACHFPLRAGTTGTRTDLEG